jgi:chlorobactene glucosyltransferase
MNLYFNTLNTLVCVIIALQLVANLTAMPRLGHTTNSKHIAETETDSIDKLHTLVSILIPARNESATITECIDAVLAQDHAHIEVFVLDDNSTDDTAAIISSIPDPRLTLVKGSALPDGWTGKNWACHQLSQHATSDTWLFLDADTVIEPHAVSSAISVQQQHNAGVVSALTASKYQSSSDVALLPMINFGLMALFPIWLMHTRFFPKVSIAMGPFLMVSRDAYRDAGGHAEEPTEVVDDVMLSRRIKAEGHPVRLCNGSLVAQTSWYGTLRGTWNGFTKNAFGAMESSIMLALVTLLFVIPFLTAPFIRLLWGLPTLDVPLIVSIQVVLLLFGRVVSSAVGRDPMRSIIVHPFTAIFWGATLAWSALLTCTHKSIQWRDREVRLSNP